MEGSTVLENLGIEVLFSSLSREIPFLLSPIKHVLIFL